MGPKRKPKNALDADQSTSRAEIVALQKELERRKERRKQREPNGTKGFARSDGQQLKLGENGEVRILNGRFVNVEPGENE